MTSEIRNGGLLNGGSGDAHHHHPYGKDQQIFESINDDELDDYSDLDDDDNGSNGIHSKQRTNIDMQRIKRKAIRRLESNKSIHHSTDNGLIDADDLVNGHGMMVNGINGFPRNTHSCLKKFSKNSRRPRGRFGRGLTKKGGAGGKGTWGKPGISELVGVEEEPNDPRDPNYDSDSTENCKFEAITPPMTEDEIEKHVTPLISEYYEHGDIEEVITSLEELNFGEIPYQLLVVIVTLAMERKASHREMTSVLISDLYGRILLEEDIERGFDILLKSLPDLILDTPAASTVLGNFIARAVADDCIPPKFVQMFKGTADYPHMTVAIEHANALLNMKHGLVKLDTVWGVCGGMRPVKYLIRQMQLILKEYVSSGELEEATRCLQELEVPHFHHEFVYEAVIMSIEDMGDKTMELICALLKSLCTSVIVTIDQMKNGFTRVYEEMPEICIDVPLAYQVLEKLVNKINDQGFMPQELFKKLPTRGRKRFVSEGDGGAVKDA